MINGLFEDNKTRSMSDDILARFKDGYNPDKDYHQAMYDKYFPIYKNENIDIERIFSNHDEDYMQEVSYFVLQLAKNMRDEYINPKPDYKDLKDLLKVDLDRLPDIKELSITTGLGFCDHFTKEGRLSCPIVGKGNANALSMIKDDFSLYKAVLKAFYFHKKRVSARAVLRTVELITPVVSNFRPVSAAKIWHEYGVVPARKRNQDYVAILVSSEGWLGRLLSSYLIADNNQDLDVYYTSIDPNPIVNREGRRMIKMLNEFHPLDNWHPELQMIGSETFDEKRLDKHGNEIGFDVQFTSPPYFNTEVYHEGYKIYLDDESMLVLADNEEALVSYPMNRYDDDTLCKVPALEIGMHLKDYEADIVKIVQVGQSHSKFRTAAEWKQNFQLATFKKTFDLLKPGAYHIINIANVNTCMELEQWTVENMKEAGFDYLYESWYKLSRKPSKNQESEITARKGEPIFISRKPK